MLNQPFFQVTLPLMVTFIATVWAATYSQNKRFEDLKADLNRRFDELRNDMNRRFEEIVMRLDRIEAKLSEHDKRLASLETAKWR